MNSKTVAECRSIRDALIPEIELWRENMAPLTLFKDGMATKEAIQMINGSTEVLSELIKVETKIYGGIMSRQETLVRAKALFFLCASFINDQLKEAGQNNDIKYTVGGTYFYGAMDQNSLSISLDEFNSQKDYGCKSAGLLGSVESLSNESLSIIALVS